jgi:ATP-dependent Lon protease
MSDSETMHELPLLPLKNTALFPFLMTPLSVGRPSSLAAVEAALATEHKEILVVAQRDPNVETPGIDDLYPVGTKAIVRRMARPSDEMMELLVLGVERVSIVKVTQAEPFLSARFSSFPLPEDGGAEVEALQRAIIDQASHAIQLAQPQSPPELTRALVESGDPMRLVFMLASMFSLDLAKEQALLEVQTRLEALDRKSVV